MMKMASGDDSPSGRLPEKGLGWFLVDTEACGGRTSHLRLPQGFSEYLGIYRAKRWWRGASRGLSNSGLRKTLSKFKLWGACEELNFPNLPTRRLYELAQRTRKEGGTRQFTQVRATLRCNTLLLLYGGLPRGGLRMN
jgi:hypothetical protein